MTPRFPHRLPLAALGTLARLGALVGLTGCPLLQLEVQVEEVCISRTGVVVEASAGQRAAFALMFDDLGAAKDLLEAEDELRFVRFEARAQTGVPDLAFLDAVQVTLTSSPDAMLPSTLVFACDGDCVDGDGALAMAPASDDNAVEYLRATSVAAEVALRGQLPTQAWTIDVDVCLSGEVTRTLEP